MSASLGKKKSSSSSVTNPELVTSTMSKKLSGVGRYLRQSAKRSIFDLNVDSAVAGNGRPSGTTGGGDKGRKQPLSMPPIKKIKKAPPTKTKFGDFSGW